MGDLHNRALISDLEHRLDQFLAIDEAYWKQRARSDWLHGGDRNTNFFHHKASSHNRNNFIKGIMSNSNNWVTNDQEITFIFKEYFTSLFSSSRPSQHDIDGAIAGLDQRVNEDIRCSLDAPYTPEEIKAALFGMSPWKSPGPDGFHIGFY